MRYNPINCPKLENGGSVHWSQDRSVTCYSAGLPIQFNVTSVCHHSGEFLALYTARDPDSASLLDIAVNSLIFEIFRMCAR